MPGKDIVCFNLMLHAALKKPGVYYYIFPTFAQAKRVIWNSVTNDGQRFIDFIPKQLIQGVPNSQEMLIRLINGSIIQLVGSDNYNALMGSNPQGIVFSEYALQDHRANQYLRPILVANNGWAIYISTPRSKNHLYDLYEIAQANPDDWFCELLTIDDTGVVSKEQVQKDIDDREMSETLARQEYWCTWNESDGSYYGEYMHRLREQGHIREIPWIESQLVNTAWDLGVNDATAIIFYQYINGTLYIIDAYQSTDKGLDSHIHYVKQKPYVYGKHIAPFDIQVREMSNGISRKVIAQQLGINFTVAPPPAEIRLEDGIEAVRATLPKTYFDKVKCKELIWALENYRQKMGRDGRLLNTPEHNHASHMADAFRYLSITIRKVEKRGMTQEDADKIRFEAQGGYAQSHYNPYSPL